MLLSNILKISKNLKELNESYKSSFIKNLNNQFKECDLSYNINPINSKDSINISNINFEYYYKAKYHNLTQNDCDTISGREKMLNAKVTKGNFDIFNYLHKLIKDSNLDITFDIGSYTDDDFIEISKEEALTSKYKDTLLFWLTYDYKNSTYPLIALSYGPKLLLYIDTYTYQYIYKVNTNYKGPTNMENFNDYNSKELDDFIKEAFIKIPVIKLYNHNDTKEIKSRIQAKSIRGPFSIKTILNSQYNGIVGVKALKPKSYKNSIKKIKSRKEWANFVENQKNKIRLNQIYYKKIKFVKQNICNVNEQLNKLDNLMEIINNYYLYIVQKQEYIFDNFNSITIDYSGIFADELSTFYKTNYSIYHPLDCFNLILTFFSEIIEKIITTKKYLQQIDILSQNEKENIYKLTDNISLYKKSSEDLKNYIENNKNYINKAISKLKSSKIILSSDNFDNFDELYNIIKN